MLLERRCSRATDVLVSLAEGPPGRADLARRRAITLQAVSHKDDSGTGSGPLLAITAGQATHIGLCRPPGALPWLASTEPSQPLRATPEPAGKPRRTVAGVVSMIRRRIKRGNSDLAAGVLAQLMRSSRLTRRGALV